MKNKRKPSLFKKIVNTVTFISFSLLIIRVGYLGRVDPEIMAVLFLFLIVVLAIGKKLLYAILGIVGSVLFLKLSTNNNQEFWSVITSLVTLFLVSGVLYKMVKSLFSK